MQLKLYFILSYFILFYFSAEPQFSVVIMIELT